ncbi:hypothetical protein [Oceanobacillus sojae]|uniref:Uncharacterized protein n=1 Tax=Oceanobacillus sojae TaxID=582851 RepID=A0A511ZQQ5_9BACI|nr:hypothetical protein [Oceanobacillus sojae]GEN89788.1 hypothetical protein OSO01_45270 [Oceanobacillus sojae]
MFAHFIPSKMDRDVNEPRIHKINKKFRFEKIDKIKNDYLWSSYQFAYKMSFTKEGHHRRNRSGGKDERGDVQIFCDTFNGKLGEFAVYQYFISKGINTPYPDVNIMGEGEWDSYDFLIETGTTKRKIGIKATKKIGNLLLLETKDWNKQAQYIPNLDRGYADYDEMILVRVDSEIIKNLKNKDLYSNDIIDEAVLREELNKSSYEFDIAGVVPKRMLIAAIRNKNIIKQSDFLQSTWTEMDADNYYVQSGDMLRIDAYIDLLKKEMSL